jgi:hypothetical protein
MASAQKTLADMLLKETCPSLAAFVNEGLKDGTTSEVAAAAAAGYKTCKQSLVALQNVKLKYPQATLHPPSLSSSTSSSSHSTLSSTITSDQPIAPSTDTGVVITCVRPVAAAAATAVSDLDSFLKYAHRNLGQQSHRFFVAKHVI